MLTIRIVRVENAKRKGRRNDGAGTLSRGADSMRNLWIVVLLFSTGCASMRRHPIVYGVVAGVAVGATVALATRHNCGHVYDGKPYDGTPPCPK